MDRRTCAFILTHGRPDRVYTLTGLERAGFSGDWFIVIDNEDATGGEYVRRFGADRVIVFDKQAVAATLDTADLSRDYRSVVFARNVAFDLARERGYTHFVEMDDDYNHFTHRWQDATGMRWAYVRNIDAVMEAMYDFLDDTGADAVAFGQGGDLIGGVKGRRWKQRVIRKVMNAVFCRASDDWRFMGRINEDVNAYTTLGTRGRLFLSTMEITLDQHDTQSQPGGMTEVYRIGGTYVKSMYPVMMCPSAVSIAAMGENRPRIHHQVRWNNCTPKIVPETFRKGSPS